MLVKNEWKQIIKRWVEVQKKKRQTKEKDEREQQRERERERGSIWFIENELHKLSSMYTAIYTCTELNKTI